MAGKEIKVRFLGGAKRIGCSAILLQANGKNILLDYGATPGAHLDFPLPVPSREINAILLTHAHIDHSGAIPLIYTVANPPLITTPATLDLAELLIYDMKNVARDPLPFGRREIRKMVRNSILLNYKEWYTIGKDIKVMFLNAGHIPGSSSILLEIDGVKIWYTGDINTIETRLLEPAKIDLEDVDIVITESTYALKNHQPRKEQEKAFIEALREVVESQGVALVPAFSVGRSQEVLCVLEQYDFRGRIILDGMARRASKIILDHPTFVKDYNLFVNALKRAKWIENSHDRFKAVSEPGVIVAPAGMLVGGSAQWYLKYIYKDENCGLFYVSYQVPGTPGRRILETGKVRIGRKQRKLRARVGYFELSSHSGRTQLFELIEKFDSDTVFFTVHGEEESVTKFAEEIRDQYGYTAFSPNVGETFEIEAE